MRKKYLGLVGLLSLLGLMIVFTQKVKADVNYDINNVAVTAKVNRDGSVTMHREFNYSFDSDAHGVFYRQNLTKKQKITNIQVKVNNHPVKLSQSGKNNTYQLTKNKNSYKFKVFHNIAEADAVKVEYSYKILHLITNYQDTAELNFKIIGNGWDADLYHVRATVIFPGSVKGLKAWAHGPLDGYTQVLPRQGKIIMTADDVAGDSGVEVHALFPTSVTAINTNVVKENRKKAIEKQEAQLANEANRKRRNRSYVNWTVVAISLVSGLFVVIKGLFNKKAGFKPKKTKELSHNYDIPDVNPVGAQILDNVALPNTKAFTAYLMQLAGQHKVKIEEYHTKHLKKTHYQISLVDKSILADELIYFLFKQVGDGNSFTTNSLKKYASKKLGQKFDEWCNKQYDAVTAAGYLDDKIERQRSHYRKLTITGIVLSTITWVIAVFRFNANTYIVLIGIGLILLEFIAFFIGNHRLSLYTQKGAIETNKVRGFEKMLDDIGRFKMKDVGDLILWEDIMPYAVAFGLSKKVLKQLKLEFSQEELSSTGFIVGSAFYSPGNDGFANNFESSFSSGVSYGSSSVSGTSGGFSGGSSGGIGGGSGGGAF